VNEKYGMMIMMIKKKKWKKGEGGKPPNKEACR
jgi:hypothetical protein